MTSSSSRNRGVAERTTRTLTLCFQSGAIKPIVAGRDVSRVRRQQLYHGNGIIWEWQLRTSVDGSDHLPKETST
jgi:hypothetical protein